MTIKYLLGLAILFNLISCGSKADQQTSKQQPNKDTNSKIDQDVTPAATIRPPVINITDTVSRRQTVLYMKDSAAAVNGISKKLAEILGFKLDALIKKRKLKVTGKPVVWYTSAKAPYFFEAGLPVDKKPSQLPGNIMVREIAMDSIVVAHFYGPYELLPQAYEALKDWMKAHKKQLKGTPYEIYVGDPLDKAGNPIDPYRVQTDLIFPWK